MEQLGCHNSTSAFGTLLHNNRSGQQDEILWLVPALNLSIQKMLESRPEDAVVKLVNLIKLANPVKLVKPWRLY